MKSVAITGISGYIGERLLARLHDLEEVASIVGIDLRPPRYSSPKLKFYRRHILEPLEAIFTENKVKSAIHLAFVLKPTRDVQGARQTDIDGTLNFLQACHQAQVKHILYLSSHTVYGAHPDNPVPLKEDAPLRPLSEFQYSWDKVEVERMLQNFASSHQDIKLTILRSCPVVGPKAANSVAALMFKPPVMVTVAGYDPPLQFVHEDDLVELIITLLRRKQAGIFNVAGDGVVQYSELAKLSGKRRLALPEKWLRLLMSASWVLRLQSESPASGLEFIKYPPIVSTEKLKKELGFKFTYSSREALQSFLATR